MRSRLACSLAVAAAVACGAVPARVAFAAPTPTAGDKAAAQALFDEGLKLMTGGKHAQACPKLEESLRLDPAMGTRFRLSECYEAVGKTASAWAGYVEVADLARASGQASREKVARERATRLEPSLCRLEIVVATPTLAGLEVRRDDVVVGTAQWGAKIPIDRGTAHVTASAPGKIAWKGEVTITKAGESAVVRVPALVDAPVATPPVPVPGPAPNAVAGSPTAAPPPATREAAPPPADSPSGTRRTVGIVVFGVGLAAVGTSGVLGLMALSKYNGTGGHCTGDVCDLQGKEDTDAARRLGTIATVVFGVGAVMAVGGAVLWLTAPSGSAAPSRAALRVRLLPSAALLEGAF